MDYDEGSFRLLVNWKGINASLFKWDAIGITSISVVRSFSDFYYMFGFLCGGHLYFAGAGKRNFFFLSNGKIKF